jgi:hypothetical protein
MTVTRIPVQTRARAAAVQLLTDFKADSGIGLQIYRARPGSIHPPTAFVDAMGESITYYAGFHHDREVRVELVVLHGRFDHGDTVDQRDAFVDAFHEWVLEHRDELDGRADFRVAGVDDEPSFVPDWLPPEVQRTYYGTRITLEGFTSNG